MSRQIQVFVDYPISAASKWADSTGRTYSEVKTKFLKSDPSKVCGFGCFLAGNVRLEMSIDWDPQNGFHVDVQKGNQYRSFIKQGAGQKKGAAAGGGNVSVLDWRTAISDLNNWYTTGSEKHMVDALVSGQVICQN